MLIVHIKRGAVDICNLADIGNGYFLRRTAFQKLKIGILNQLFGHANASVIRHVLPTFFEATPQALKVRGAA